MPFHHIALAGATGTLGSVILTTLTRSFPTSSITILTRQSSSQSTYPSDIKVVTLPSYSDFDALVQALEGQDILLSALNHTAAFEHEPTLVRAAIQAGVRRFMPSEYTMDVSHPAYRKAAESSPLALKRVALAEDLEEAAKVGKIEYTTLVPGPFLDLCIGSFWGFDIKERRAVLYDEGKARGTGSTLEFTAECLVNVLRMPEEETRNRRFRIAEAEYTGQEILKDFERATETKWAVETKGPDKLEQEEEDKMRKEGVKGAYETWVVRMNLNGSAPTMLEDGLAWNKTGEFAIKRKTLREIVKNNVEKASNNS